MSVDIGHVRVQRRSRSALEDATIKVSERLPEAEQDHESQSDRADGTTDKGLAALLSDHWSVVAPFRSPYTQRTTKYSSVAFNPGSPYRSEGLLQDLAEIVSQFRPTTLYLPHPLDAHEDHSAGYAFVCMAIEKLEAAKSEFVRPSLRCCLVHSYAGLWPTPSALRDVLPMNPLDAFIEFGTWHTTLLQCRRSMPSTGRCGRTRLNGGRPVPS